MKLIIAPGDRVLMGDLTKPQVLFPKLKIHSKDGERQYKKETYIFTYINGQIEMCFFIRQVICVIIISNALFP